ncbi:MAG: 50S ribosomal protein L30 [Holosporaceae bacterium]|jgi:large subunit ribosomal protein L30|nr:50S ribosomal protein L30 [Holosporaceae bacterium]
MVKSKSKTCNLCVVQTGSGARCEKSQVQSLRALGLGRIGKKVLLQDNGCVRGLIKKVSHLIRVEEGK